MKEPGIFVLTQDIGAGLTTKLAVYPSRRSFPPDCATQKTASLLSWSVAL